MKKNAKPAVSSTVERLVLAPRLAILLTRRTSHTADAVIIHNADQARGRRCDAVVWLRDPTQAERECVLPCMAFSPGEERVALRENKSSTGQEPA